MKKSIYIPLLTLILSCSMPHKSGVISHSSLVLPEHITFELPEETQLIRTEEYGEYEDWLKLGLYKNFIKTTYKTVEGENLWEPVPEAPQLPYAPTLGDTQMKVEVDKITITHNGRVYGYTLAYYDTKYISTPTGGEIHLTKKTDLNVYLHISFNVSGLRISGRNNSRPIVSDLTLFFIGNNPFWLPIKENYCAVDQETRMGYTEEPIKRVEVTDKKIAIYHRGETPGSETKKDEWQIIPAYYDVDSTIVRTQINNGVSLELRYVTKTVVHGPREPNYFATLKTVEVWIKSDGSFEHKYDLASYEAFK